MDRIFTEEDGAFLMGRSSGELSVWTRQDSFLVANNHPDGSLFPSGEDKMLTGYLLKGKKVLDIRFIAIM